MTMKRTPLPPTKYTKPINGRAEIVELAQALMPEALERLARILQTSTSDLAVLQAFRAIKETAYGKDMSEALMAIDPESLTDEQLAAIAAGGIVASADAKEG